MMATSLPLVGLVGAVAAMVVFFGEFSVQVRIERRGLRPADRQKVAAFIASRGGKGRSA
jgi:hypothetical protein